MFHIATEEDIRSGATTDVYFLRTQQIMAAEGVDASVVAEIRAEGLPADWEWGILAGIEEAAHLLSGVDVDVDALTEGAVFLPGEPVLVVRGKYSTFWLRMQPCALIPEGTLLMAVQTCRWSLGCAEAAGRKVGGIRTLAWVTVEHRGPIGTHV